MYIPDINKQIYKEDVLSVLESKYSVVGPMWVNYQMEWMNGVYASFKDHDKFLIIIFLIKKTLDFYSRNFTKLTYEEFYSRDTVEIEKFTLSEISQTLNIPKESTRRKIFELEKEGAIKKVKKKLIIDRSKFFKSKPVKSIQRICRFLSLLSDICEKEKIMPEKISSKNLELIVKHNFSYIWKIYYEMQIPMVVSFKKIFKDIETFHIFGICVVNQHLYAKKISDTYMNREKFIKTTLVWSENQGINAMSISDISGIPRATVIRKLKILVKNESLTIDDNKHYRLTGNYLKKNFPAQKEVLFKLANFAAQVFNLKLLEKKKTI
tara:strand:- start:1264 stop:2232 length:969 start_codon:yes stop_codon:yes gene_type:complete